MISTKSLRLSSMPPLELNVRSCGRLPNRPGVSPTRTSSAAHRAFYRTPGRPQTAAFAPVRSTGGPAPRRSASADPARLRDCMMTNRASIEPRSDASSVADDEETTTVATVVATTKTAVSRNKDRDLYRPSRLSKPDTGSKADRVVEDVLSGQKSTTKSSPAKSLTKSRSKTVKTWLDRQSSFSTSTSSTLETLPPPDNVDRTTSSDVEEVMTNGSGESSMSAIPTGQMMPCDSTSRTSAVTSCRPKLVVYHFVGSPDRRRAAVRSETSTVICDEQKVKVEIEDDDDDVSKYAVDVQSDVGSQDSVAGLKDSPKNVILQDLLRRQLALNDRQQSTSDDSVIKDVESLNVLVSQFINVRPPTGQVYYFACGPDTSSERFSKLIHRKPEDSSWALLYGFRMVSGTRRPVGDGADHLTWPRVEFFPQSAVQGRVYVITRDEAAMVDSYVNSTQGFQTVLLPVWLVEDNDNECGTAEYCLPALVCVHPSKCL